MVTRKQAEQVLAAVRSRHEGYWGDSESSAPKLVENWDWLESGPTRWAIVWEEGPYEWAYRASMGGTDEEMTSLVADEFGSGAARAVKLEEPLRVSGLFLEPVTMWALGIYEA